MEKINKENLPSRLPHGLFATNYSVPKNTPIITFSDIHADTDGLIISLRDCGKVIKKKKITEIINNELIKSINEDQINLSYAVKYGATIYNYMKNGKNYLESLNQCLINFPLRQSENLDIDILRYKSKNILLESFLNLNLNTDESIYENDLGYEWCGNNSHIVIIGDILDGNRDGSSKKHLSLDSWIQYFQVEIKILKFLNILDVYAEKTQGRIIKLLGNHEIMNICDDGLEPYIFSNPNTNIDTKTYYDNLSRKEYFNIKNPGFELLRERGIGVILKINNNIFVHGSLIISDTSPFNFEFYYELNLKLNNKQVPLNTYANLIMKLNDMQNSVLWIRNDGDTMNSGKRNQKKKYGDTTESNMYCDNLGNRLVKFSNLVSQYSNDVERYNRNDILRLMVGHCVQSDVSYILPSQQLNFPYYTFKLLKENDERTETYTTIKEDDIYFGNVNPSENIVFGITMECIDQKQSVYRVDVGQSRGFDLDSYNKYIIDYKDNENMQKNTLLSRSPQVLKIVNNNLEIIRSKFLNTRIEQPRVWYESQWNNNEKNKTFLNAVNKNKSVRDIEFKEKNEKYRTKNMELYN